MLHPQGNGEQVTVIFRKYSNGDIIALFPTVRADIRGFLCQSYMHIGQHGAADYRKVIDDTKPANEDEYSVLLQELRMIGYNDLTVRKRWRAT